MNFYRHHMGDYFTATRHLTWDEDLAYRRLIEAYYAHEKPLPLDKKRLCQMIGATALKHREAVDRVLAEFFTEKDDGYHNARCEEEIADANAKREKASESAYRRWQRNANGHANASASAMRTHSEGNAPTPTPIYKKRAKGRSGASPEGGTVPVFEGTEAWEAWVKYRGKSPPKTDIRIEGQPIRSGWYFPSEFPPASAP